jgi:hypothetical protein
MNSTAAMLLCALLSVASPALGDEPTAAPAPATATTASPVASSDPLLERLSPEQLQAVLVAREEARVRLARIEHGTSDSKIAILVPMFFFAAVLLGMAAALYFRFRRDRQLHETLRAMIERGVSIPVELLTPPRPRHADLRRGLVLVGAGAGLGVFLFVVEGLGRGVWAAGLIPLFVGIGYLAAWRYEQREPYAGPRSE